jgi:hypothetical protein
MSLPPFLTLAVELNRTSGSATSKLVLFCCNQTTTRMLECMSSSRRQATQTTNGARRGPATYVRSPQRAAVRQRIWPTSAVLARVYGRLAMLMDDQFGVDNFGQQRWTEAVDSHWRLIIALCIIMGTRAIASKQRAGDGIWPLIISQLPSTTGLYIGGYRRSSPDGDERAHTFLQIVG